jgi:hypothetical protein
VYVRCALCLDVWSVKKPEGDRVNVLTW